MHCDFATLRSNVVVFGQTLTVRTAQLSRGTHTPSVLRCSDAPVIPSEGVRDARCRSQRRWRILNTPNVWPARVSTNLTGKASWLGADPLRGPADQAAR